MLIAILLCCSVDSTKNLDTSEIMDTSDTSEVQDTDTSPPDTSDTSEPEDTFLRVDVGDYSAQDGSILFDLEVPEGVSAFQFNLQSDKFVGLYSIVNPDGMIVYNYIDWLSSDEILLDAVNPLLRQVAIPWPTRMEDGPLEPGLWTIQVGAFNNEGGYEPGWEIRGAAMMKRDDDFSLGTMRVFAAKATGVVDNPAYVAAISALLNELESRFLLWGITLEIREGEMLISPVIPEYTYQATTLITASSNTTEDETLVLFGDVVGVNNQSVEVGYTPGIMIPTQRSLIGMGWDDAVGSDGQLDSSELDIWTEELLQALAHSMGVHHPVDMDSWKYDALSDTPTCTSIEECETELGSNVMFPYPVCDDEGACIPRTELSPMQIEQLHLYTGVL